NTFDPQDNSPAWAVAYTKPVPPPNNTTPVPPPGDTTPPETVKGKGPKKKIQKRTAKFHFTSEAGATFRCKLDGRLAAPCVDGVGVKRLKKGKHKFRVQAVDAAGNADSTPATWKFKVIGK
ncbi:MAG TPA: hypothetical protein VGP44_02415, partial [Gemmatimonadales bacterium]|nr:hypothetical protein [Gemmatimonadales bacterium]